MSCYHYAKRADKAANGANVNGKIINFPSPNGAGKSSASSRLMNVRNCLQLEMKLAYREKHGAEALGPIFQQIERLYAFDLIYLWDYDCTRDIWDSNDLDDQSLCSI